MKNGYLVILYKGRNNTTNGIPLCVCLNKDEAIYQAEQAFNELSISSMSSFRWTGLYFNEYEKLEYYNRYGELRGSIQLEEIKVY